MSSDTLKRTALYDWHVAHGGRMVPFAGWEMPVFYPTGAIEEHRTTRRAAGLFDIGHMGQINVSGPQAEAYLNQLVTWDVTMMEPYDAHYALMCYQHGGIVDDVFIYRLPDSWLVVVNASNTAKDVAWMQEHSSDYDITLRDISPMTHMLALQGPQAIELLQHLTSVELDSLPRFTAIDAEVNESDTLIGRTGYTGEDGVELFFPVEYALPMWEAILAAGADHDIEVKPIGLAARDSLRAEACFPLYGHEIDADVTPLEARLTWACQFTTDFIGRAALLRQQETGINQKLISFELTEKGVPRQDYPLATPEGTQIGTVTTGLYAPTVDKYCGHGFVPPEYAAVGTPLQVIIRDRTKAAVVVKRPFYTPTYRK